MSFAVCIPVTTDAQLVRAVRYGSFIELWLDRLLPEATRASSTLQKKVVALFARAGGVPIIAVCRGGENQVEVLIAAARARAAYVDVDSKTSPASIKKLAAACLSTKKPKHFGTKLIISYHNWKSTPSIAELEKIVARARRLGADVVKIATMVKKWSDNALLFELTRRMVARRIPIIVVGMGEKGKIGRIGCAVLGGEFTFVALDAKSRTAPGQPTLAELKEIV